MALQLSTVLAAILLLAVPIHIEPKCISNVSYVFLTIIMQQVINLLPFGLSSSNAVGYHFANSVVMLLKNF